MAQWPAHSRRKKVTLTTIVRLDSHMLGNLTSDKAIVLHIHQAIRLAQKIHYQRVKSPSNQTNAVY